MIIIVGAVLVYAVIPKGNSGTASKLTSVIHTVSNEYSYTVQETISAGGSSFVNPIMQEWVYNYITITDGNVQINYASVGSGAGISGIIQNTFQYAGSDAPVPHADLSNVTDNALLEFPDSLGGVAIFYYIPGINNASLKMTGPVLAGIWNQSITLWNAPQIAALNPGITLPAHPIIVVHRSDGSGTTYALTTYFSKIDPTWNSTIGVGTSVDWPSTELGTPGSAGIAALVSETPYAIGYVDTYYVFQNPGLTIATVQNSAGNWIFPNDTTVAAAANADSAEVQANPTYSITDAPGANSYPISTYTYILVWKNQPNQQVGDAMATFFWYAVHSGQSEGPKLGYPELPANIVSIDEGIIEQMNYNGQAFITAT